MRERARKVLVSAGDPSGDLILARVIREINLEMGENAPEFVGLAGPACAAEGVRLIAQSHEVAVVGLWEVLRHLPKIFGVLRRMENELRSGVDSLLCVDFPDFNFRLAELAYRNAVPIDYIVAPQVWAWRRGRLTTLKRLLRRLYVALPFEEELFRDAGVDAVFFGHPVRDLLPPRSRRQARETLGLGPEEFVLCLLPGSRHNEISKNLPLMLQAWRQRLLSNSGKVSFLNVEKWRAVVPLAPGWTEVRVREILDTASLKLLDEGLQTGALKIVSDSRLALMAADFGWITSGTATLEAAYYQLPHILVYKLSRLSAFLIRQVTTYFDTSESFAGLPNILMQKRVIPELLQEDLSAKRLMIETLELLLNPGAMNTMRQNLKWIPKRMGEPGATNRIAKDLISRWH